ncbi:MAG TPA: long-chain fatty acid--CoA ligase, partial [Pontibacter sp.]
NQGKPYPGNEAVTQDKQIKALIREAINNYNQQFNPVEQVKKFVLMPYQWTIESGELTPTLKLKRKIILEKYKNLIGSMYAA